MGLRESKAAMNLRDAVIIAHTKHNLLPLNAVLIAGVSGGTNSLALMHLLASLRDPLGFRLHVATLDHGLRGEAGAADARFVTAMAQAWDIPVTVGYADVSALANQRQIGIEAAARIARYEFLAGVAREQGAARIAVAHNADDQVETVLLHLLRGSGLSGLAGMTHAAPLPGHADLTLIRPLLDLPRADLAAYCRANGLLPRQDASNDDLTYTRNRLRRELIPQLRAISPQVERRLLQLAEIARAEDDLADSAFHAAVDAHVRREAGRIRLPRDLFVSLHPALQRRFVIWAAGRPENLSYERIAAAVDLALNGQVGARAQLKGGVQLRVDYDAVIVERDSAPRGADDLPLLPPGASIPVVIPGETPIGAGWWLIASLSEPDGEPSLRLSIPDGASVVLRTRREGDRFAPLGLEGHTQKLAKWMIDAKVPRALRDRLPLLVIDGEIAAVGWIGWKVSQRAAERGVYFGWKRGSSG